MKFRKKPVVIEAEQWVGCRRYDGMNVTIEMPIPPVPHNLLRKRWTWRGRRWQIKTLEGWYSLTPNDWIINGVIGEFYPCKPDIFEQTYEKVQ